MVPFIKLELIPSFTTSFSPALLIGVVSYGTGVRILHLIHSKVSISTMRSLIFNGALMNPWSLHLFVKMDVLNCGILYLI
jgi:hypothetical protein